MREEARPAAAPAPDAATACTVGAVPDEIRIALSLSPFYEKHVAAGAISVVSSPRVPDEALCTARAVVLEMVAERPELLDRLAEKKIRLAIMAEGEVTTDIPEHSDLTPKDDWDQRARGLGATLARPAVSAAEENVLCRPTDRYRGESILVHELAHAIFDIAVALYEPEMAKRLEAAFEDAKASGRFANTYAITNTQEYWAEGVQDWFDANIEKIPADGTHNEIDTRAELVAYDPALAGLIREVFGDRPWRYACP